MKIFLAGHKGLVGSAIFRSLKRRGFNKILTIDKKIRFIRSKKSFFLPKKKQTRCCNYSSC